MMFRFKKKPENNGGFSLIELMVVMAIVATLLTLTGGVVQKNIAQQERIVELEKVSQLFKKLSYQSYYGQGPIYLRLQENKLMINEQIDAELDNTTIENSVLLFEQLTFVAQDYVISSKGIISPDSFGVFFNGNIKQFPLKAVFDEIKAK
ncbi:type II secretion system protein [Colwellia sp. 1_MG-2023]|uniref:type II secretion system protein n=1 Tax=Colwellia sp. 1_MG-2023 TaxID=3062649 RepID=UPI0026E12963|nr:type II secretion system protein [Colwellia sp. 1_MG-2023]MDO6444337.1 type II secretion system protein [Colwellia sp. 1_MG-2023]